jgi:hypothetical protein
MVETNRAADPAVLEVLSVALSDLDRHPDLLGDMYRRRYCGAVIRGAFEREHMLDLAAALEAGLPDMPRAVAPTFKGGLYGTPLVMGAEDLRDYISDADRFRRAIAPFFDGPDGLERRIEAVLSPIAGGAVVEIARTDDGRGYLPASMRVLVEGDSLPIHYENGTAKYESMKRLLPHIDVETIMSFYVPVRLPDAGGILEVFTTDCAGDGDRIIETLGGPDRARAILAERGYIEVLPQIGDMLVFDGGRYYHVVTEVRGQRARWTLGGFFAYTKAHDRILYWS